MKAKKSTEGEVLAILDLICREKGISMDILVDAIEMAVSSAARKHLGTEENIQTRFDRTNGSMEILLIKQAVETVTDPLNEMSLEKAKKYNPLVAVGEKIEIPQHFGELSRIAAQTAKQVIVQRVREAERDMIFDHYNERVGQLVTGSVLRIEKGNIVVDLGRTEAIMLKKEQSPRDNYRRGERIRAFLIEVKKTNQGPQIMLSRTHAQLLHRLFELEVPEIYEGKVEIRGAAREPGERAKICVFSNDQDIDPVGACVGMKGTRVQSIVKELRGENIDVVEWTDDTGQFIRNALSPAQVNSIYLNMETKVAQVIVADQQLSLAIGKRGQNVRLAAKLTGWKIDIKSEAELQRERAVAKEREEHMARALMELPGITIDMVNALLVGGFDNPKKLSEASIEDISKKAKGVGPARAEKIHALAQQLRDQELSPPPVVESAPAPVVESAPAPVDESAASQPESE